MVVAGIVAEYNPFHAGHAYHIARTRRMLGGECAVVAVMSGNWVQRGDCAVFDKWSRAGAALAGGADLVLELPTAWAVASAERFAQGSVGLLRATGVVDVLSFGSESGRLDDLRQVARALDGEDYRAALREELDRGTGFAQARQDAALRTLGPRAELLQGANDSLAVEYLRAAGDGLPAMAVPRLGADHDGGDHPDYPSASFLRARLRSGELPSDRPVARMEQCERAILARLRTMGAEDWAQLPDSGVAEGLPQRLVRAARECISLWEFCARAKTRRYAHARIRRLALWAYLGVRASDLPDRPLYLRVLGFNERGQALLREMKSSAALPILTKPSHIARLSPEAQRLFALEERCTDLYGLCFPVPEPCGRERRASPVALF